MFWVYKRCVVFMCIVLWVKGMYIYSNVDFMLVGSILIWWFYIKLYNVGWYVLENDLEIMYYKYIRFGEVVYELVFYKFVFVVWF